MAEVFSESLPTIPWLTVYKSRSAGDDDITIFSGLVPVDSIPKCIESGDKWGRDKWGRC